MTIHVKAGKVGLHLWFPLSILKSRIACKIANSSTKKHVKKSSENVAEAVAMPAEQSDGGVSGALHLEEQNLNGQKFGITCEQMTEIYKVLKRYVKLNGHFNLVEIHSHDGEKVIIRV